MVRRDGMEVYSGRDVDLDFDSMADECYKYMNGVRKRLLGMVFTKDIAIKTDHDIHSAFYLAGNRRIKGVGVERVLDAGLIKLPFSKTRDLCFKRKDLTTNPREYFVYVEKRNGEE